MAFPTHHVIELTPVLGGSWIEVRLLTRSLASCFLFMACAPLYLRPRISLQSLLYVANW
jgi:hypothetical protein